MKYLQKAKVTLKEGKVSKTEKGEIISVIDSVGDNLVIDGENLLKTKSNGTFEVYQEVKEADKVAQDKKAKKPNPKEKQVVKEEK